MNILGQFVSTAIVRNPFFSGTALYDDGLSGAPAGTPQLPTILNSYGANRAPWHVAGVDYAVGPNGTPTGDPATISMSGVTVNSTNHSLTVSQSNITIDGYNMNDWFIVASNVSNLTVQNCVFAMGVKVNNGANAGSFIKTANCPNVLVQYCTFDGGNQNSAVFDGGSNGCLINHLDGASVTTSVVGLTALYNWVKYAPADYFGMTSGIHLLKYNLAQNGFYSAGAHSDFAEQDSSNCDRITYLFNTNYYTPHVGNDENWVQTIEAQLGATIKVAEIGYATIIGTGSPGGSVGAGVSSIQACMAIVDAPSADRILTATVHDCYIDDTGSILGTVGSPGSGGAIYPYNNGNTTWTNNHQMLDGTTHNGFDAGW